MDRAGGPKRPALILGGRFLWALAMVRSLGRRGVPVYVTATRGHFVSYSRWHRAAPPEWGEAPSPTLVLESNWADFVAQAKPETNPLKMVPRPITT